MTARVVLSAAPRRLARGAIRLYQLTLSSLLGRQCRYLPTCSDYADEAICRHGLWAGGWMGAARICRCHPLGGSGARIMTTMLYHMRDKGIRYGLQTMCEGGGQANATIVELL